MLKKGVHLLKNLTSNIKPPASINSILIFIRTGNNAVFVKCDVSKLEELKNLFVVAAEKFGGAQVIIK
jgi:NAD(P)-dependent dehydrogenase (short-subunit alcohol dehydrogenase family)